MNLKQDLIIAIIFFCVTAMQAKTTEKCAAKNSSLTTLFGCK